MATESEIEDRVYWAIHRGVKEVINSSPGPWTFSMFHGYARHRFMVYKVISDLEDQGVVEIDEDDGLIRKLQELRCLDGLLVEI